MAEQPSKRVPKQERDELGENKRPSRKSRQDEETERLAKQAEALLKQFDFDKSDD